MALIQCSECKAEVSSLASACPKCGAPPATPAPAKAEGSTFLAKIAFGGTAIIVFLWLLSMCTGGSNTTTTTTQPDLKASVNFTGTQFVIANRDSYDWRDCKLEVNSDYQLHGVTIKAGDTVTVGGMQFAKDEGERFNPFAYKPNSFSLWCDTPTGKGFNYFTWK